MAKPKKPIEPRRVTLSRMSGELHRLQKRYDILSEAYSRLVSQHDKLNEQYVDLNEMFHVMMQKKSRDMLHEFTKEFPKEDRYAVRDIHR